jgi:glycosyltransferase involved in cell wall biosynthesis
MKFPGISIIIACLDEEHFIGKCLESLLTQTYQGETEIIIADGGSKDQSVQIINDFINRYSNIILLNNPEKFQSIGRNLAIKKSKYEYIAYIDAHSYPEKCWLQELYSAFYTISRNDDRIAGVGSVYLNASISSFSKTVFTITKSFLSGATSKHYLNIPNLTKVQHASMCLYKKDLFEKLGGFDETLQIGEDIELNQRITYIHNYNIYVNPSAKFYYFPRENFISLLKQQFRYGLWRQIANNKNRLHSLKSFVPGILLLFFMLILLPAFISVMFLYLFYPQITSYVLLLSFISTMFMILFYILIALYLILILLSSLFICIKYRLNPVLVFFITLGIHISYGSGSIYSFFIRNK